MKDLRDLKVQPERVALRGLGFGVQGLGFGVQGLGFEVEIVVG